MDYMTELAAIAKSHGGIIKTKIASEHGISKALLYKLCKEEKIHRIVKGQYILPDDIEDELLAISNRSEKVIFSHETALYLHGISDRTPPYLTEAESKLLYDLVKGNAAEGNDKITAKLLQYGYLKMNGSTYIPDVVTIRIDEVRNAVRNMDESVKSELSGLAERAKTLLKNLYDEVYGIVCADLPPVFLNDVYQCRMTVSNCYFCRGYVMAEALKSGYLLSYDQVSPAIGAHFWLDA